VVAHHQGGEHQERVTQLRFHEPTENALLHRIVFFCPATGLGVRRGKAALSSGCNTSLQIV
jgi:hypothetical protein